MGGFKPLKWYCKPVENGAWTQVVKNAFGAYTPCGVDTLVICISHLVLLGLCFYRIWRIKKDFKVKRLVMKYSILNLDGQTTLAPFEIVSLLIEAIAWCSMLVMLVVETKVYIHEFRWYARFGVIYVLVGEAVIFNLIISVQDYFNSVEPYSGYTPIRDEFIDDAEYEVLPAGEQICPERHANILSRIYFGWMTPIMQQGYKHPITEKDVWKLDTWDQTETLNNKFQRCWVGRISKAEAMAAKSSSSQCWRKIGNDLSQFVGPVILNYLLQSMQQGDPAWIGYIYAFSIFAGVALGVLMEGQYFQNVMRVGYRLRATLVRFSVSSLLCFILDNNKVWHFLVVAISKSASSFMAYGLLLLSIVIAMVLLFNELGVASLVGSLLLVFMFPIQTIVIDKMQKWSKEGLQRTDKRIGLMNEILAAMDTVKCYAWEQSFQLKVQDVRNDELSWFRKAQLLGAVAYQLWFTVISFGMFTLLGGDLTPARAFTSLALFAVLRFPLFMLPNLITQVVNANVSLKRLEELFLTEERLLLPNPPLDPTSPAISIKNGYFSWDSKAEQPTLSKINLDIPVGSLVAVVGSTGEGKTSLISAMLGELPPMRDTTTVVRGTVAYVPQVSWIFNATVRDNILFGSTFEASRYAKTIEVTALPHDLELLPGGDLTEIGERGVNISGGQKQRVSMARAVYSNSDVYIFDDPLSALDAHVGRQVFDGCIKEELQGKTRVLVTNQLHFLPEVDRILLVHEVLRVSSSTWLSVWTDQSTPKSHGAGFYNLVYALLSFGMVLVTLTNSYWLITSSLYASKRLHDGIVSTISLWAIMPLLILFYAAYLYYQSTAREIKRLDSITRSPVYAQFGEALNGLSSISCIQSL
ncbi:hypothetical protein IFM89_009685 [Coptis chinensis]|uniref:Uncharacterized protein n=1 Tax=Coptis chinensis TaxID=261450 RepID=A0A835IQP9_9MAGN|nr:hypothetical protein IFM89_009685 [Coptis chinensis]